MEISARLGAGRYRLTAPLGTGAMGQVFAAADRLSSQHVALKQVLLPPGLAPEETEQELLTLAHEFRVLAGLRHPHIISVLDYGFDAERQPFYTMELLPEAASILAAGAALPLPERVGLLIQALEALAYLHRRGVLHHDLKPENMLVAEGRLRLLDFGLAVLASQQRDSDAFGTLQYLAPEVLDAQPYTEAADLYSLGVIAYELLAGRHPFPAETMRQFLDQVLTQPPDLAPLADEPALAQVLGQLLAKAPAARPASARAAIGTLRQAAGLPEQFSDTTIRESYLQAATFVGRANELATLTAALDQARQGQGSAWLVGGESGVGKSRLLDELRTQALVAGATVLRGQAVEGGGRPYELWREPLRRLVLEIELTTLEASILHEIVPDIASLLGRPVPPATPLAGEAGQQRLMLTIVDQFKRQTQPTVLILEDLQWSGESLSVLKQLVRSMADTPLLILANYRHDERPDLPQALPGMRVLPLKRLSETEIAALSQSMLGEAGMQAPVVSFLQRETEGNVFFLVEVVRALAEESGSLSQVGVTALPAQVFAGGIQQLVRRRLARVPGWAQGLLKLAAVAGRQLDLEVLQALLSAGAASLGPGQLEQWLATCADVAVLEIAEGQWRFAHDKVREALVADLSAAERCGLHRQVAEMLEAIYPDDGALAEQLLGHWREANHAAKERFYILKVAARWLKNGMNYREARALLEHGLELAHGSPNAEAQRMELYYWLGKANSWLAEYEAAVWQYEQSLALAERLGDTAGSATTLLGLARTVAHQGDLTTARLKCEQALALFRQLNDVKGIADCLSNLGMIAGDEGDFPRADEAFLQALALFRTIDETDGIYSCLNNLGVTSDSQANYALAQEYYMQALSMAQEVNNQQGFSLILGNLSRLAFGDNDLATAHEYLSKSLKIARQLNDQRGEGYHLGNLGLIALEQGDFAAAHEYLEHALTTFQTIDAPADIAMALNDLAQLAWRQYEDTAAYDYFERGLTLLRELNQPILIPQILYQRAWLNLERGKLEAAQSDLGESLALAQTHHLVMSMLVAVLGYAYLALAHGQPARAAELVGLVEPRLELNAMSRKHYLQPILTRLEAALPPEQLAPARQRGAGLELKVVIYDLLDVAGP